VLYGSHLLSGHINPETIDPEWFAARRGGDMAATLEQALLAHDVADTLAALAPPQPGYGHLKEALARYREIPGWSPIEEGPALRSGDRNPRVAALRARLAATGDLPRADREVHDVELFDDRLDEAVRRFQARHGADVDGVVGKDTILELNRPVEDRIRQIAVNLERWRWLPQTLGRRHVLVNIAGFDARAVEDGASVLEMRAIVGRTYRRTPVFSDRISYLVLNPSWTIPPSIAVQDKLPLIRKDPSYLARQGIKVYAGWGSEAQEIDPATIDWGAFGGKSFRLKDEVYQFTHPYTRADRRVLLTLDLSDTATRRVTRKVKRTDGDFAVAWIRNVDEGRLFYCGLGHGADAFCNRAVVQFYLDGIQFALGDLQADADPG